MKLLTIKKLMSIIVAGIALAGCATPTVHKPVLMSPKIKGMDKVDTLAVTSVKGQSGRSYNGDANVVKHKLSSFLSGITAPGKPGFKVVDNQTLQSVIKQQKLVENSVFDSKTSIRLGKLLGADALINASYQISNASEQRFQNEYTDYDTCVEYKDDGKKCKKYKKRTESCTERSISVELIPSVVSVTTGEIIFSNSYASNMSSSKCPSKGNTLSSANALVNAGFNNVFSQMRKDIYFYEVILKIKMIESDESSMPKSSKLFLETAMELVEQNLIDRACGQIEKAAAGFNQSPALMYNMGVCKEIKGETDFAKGFYEKSLEYSALLSSSDKDSVYRAIRRMDGTENLDSHNTTQKTLTDKLNDLKNRITGF